MILLTGHEGFIGSHFLKALQAQHKDVMLVEKEDVHNLFVTEPEKDAVNWDEIELIIHMGADSSTVGTNPRRYWTYNIDFTIKLFEKAIIHKIPVKYASSASVYGNNFPEYNPLNFYALSKLTIDYWVLENLDRFESIQGYRFFNVYGTNEDHKVIADQASPISKFVKQIEQRGYIELFDGSASIYRDFVWVGNCVDIVLYEEPPSGIYDLGTSKPVSFQHVAEMVTKAYGGEIRYIPFPDHLVGKYQDYTCAANHWPGYEFLTVENYLCPDESLVHSSEGY